MQKGVFKKSIKMKGKEAKRYQSYSGARVRENWISGGNQVSGTSGREEMERGGGGGSRPGLKKEN